MAEASPDILYGCPGMLVLGSLFIVFGNIQMQMKFSFRR